MLKFEYGSYILQSQTLQGIRELLDPNREIKAIIADELHKKIISIDDPVWAKDRKFINFNGILVEEILVHMRGINQEYLDQKIQGDTVYASTIRYSQGLPCHGAPYKLEKANGITEEEFIEYGYKPIEYQDEETIADLYANAWKYKFSWKTETFQRLSEDEALQVLSKLLIARRVSKIGGHPNDRIADYGRLILFLLSKVQLSDEDKSALGDLLDYLPEAKDIAHVADREALIQKTVHYNKENIRSIVGLE